MERIQRVETGRALDVYDAAMPLYAISKILGLAPFGIRGKRGKRKYVGNIGTFSILRLVALLGTMIFVAALLEKHQVPYDMAGVAMRCELYLGIGLTGSVLVLALTNQYLVISAVKSVIRIDGDMRNAGIEVGYKNARRFCFCENLGMFSVFLTKGIVQIFSASGIFTGLFCVFNLVDYLNTIMLFQYTDLLLLLRQRYIWLNRQLIYLHASNRPVYPNEFKSFKPGKWQETEEGLLLLQKLGCIHSDLYETGQIVNRAYSLQLLLTVGARFLMVTTQLLNTYKMASDSSRNSSTISFVLAGIYVLLHTLKVFMVASISDNTADKAKQTAVKLHKIWDSTPELKQNIHHFSLQILQQNTNFTAGGFFTLNYELMYNMLGALTTYLIILIQFDTAKQDPGSGNSTTTKMTDT